MKKEESKINNKEIRIALANWNIEEMTGYKPKTTFYTDFSIADHYGEEAIKDTYKRAFNEWKHDYEYLTELVMCLNWKIWEHYDQSKTDEENYIARLYNDLWEKTDLYARDNLKGNELEYFYTTTD